MAKRIDVVQLVQHALERPLESISEISKATRSFPIDVPYSHIWTSYIASKAGLAESQAPLTASCDKGANWFRKRKRYKVSQIYGGDYSPCPGDFVYCSSTYEQADATSVGIVLKNDGIFIQYAQWIDGQPVECTSYLSNETIIGYGVPEYVDSGFGDIRLSQLATKGNGVVIIGEECTVYNGPDCDTVRVGTLKKGHAAEILHTMPNGWFKIVWGLCATGYAFIDNTKLHHKVLHDEIPYPEYKGFTVGDNVRFIGGRMFKQPNGGKSKLHTPFDGTIAGESENMFCLAKDKIKGWVYKNSVDFIPKAGYNKNIGEVVVDKACLRIGPGKEFTKVQKWPQMAKGNIVEILGTELDNNNKDWYWIVIGGVKGYVEECCIEDHIEA